MEYYSNSQWHSRQSWQVSDNDNSRHTCVREMRNSSENFGRSLGSAAQQRSISWYQSSGQRSGCSRRRNSGSSTACIICYHHSTAHTVTDVLHFICRNVAAAGFGSIWSLNSCKSQGRSQVCEDITAHLHWLPTIQVSKSNNAALTWMNTDKK